MTTVVHPARYSRPIMDRLAGLLVEHKGRWVGSPVVDPFAGTGRIHEIAALAAEFRRPSLGVEIEPEWAALHPRTIIGNALALPFRDGSVRYWMTSPCYGNRYSDHHRARDGSLRRSYTHDLQRFTGNEERTLHPDNAGTLPWGPKYQAFHEQAWGEVTRCSTLGARFWLNVSDFCRRGEVVPVVDWHRRTLEGLGWMLYDRVEVTTTRMRFGGHAGNGSVESRQETGATARRRAESEAILCLELVT